MMWHSTYHGINIYRQHERGKLPWVTVSPRLAADTLEGIRWAIRQAVDK